MAIPTYDTVTPLTLWLRQALDRVQA